MKVNQLGARVVSELRKRPGGIVKAEDGRLERRLAPMIGQPKNSHGYKQTKRALRHEEANGTVIIESVESIMRQVQLVDSLQAVQQVVEPTTIPTKEVTMQDAVVPVEEASEPKATAEQPQKQPSKLTQVNVVLCAIRVLLSADEGQYTGSVEALVAAVKGEVELSAKAVKECLAQLREHEFFWRTGTRRNPVYHINMDAAREVTASMIGEPEPESEPKQEQDTEPITEVEAVISTPTTEDKTMPEELTSGDEASVSAETVTSSTQKDKPKTLIDEVLDVAKRVDEENDRLRERNGTLEEEVRRLKVELREANERLASYETPSPEVREFLEAHAIKID